MLTNRCLSPGESFGEHEPKLVSDVKFLTRKTTAELRENERNQRCVFSLGHVQSLMCFFKIYGQLIIYFAKLNFHVSASNNLGPIS